MDTQQDTQEPSEPAVVANDPQAELRAQVEAMLPKRPPKPPVGAPKSGMVWQRYRMAVKNWEEKCRRIRRAAGLKPLSSSEANARAKAKRGMTVAQLVDAGLMSPLAALLPPTPKWTPEAGQITKYSPELAAQIVERVASGETITSITNHRGMPTFAAWRSWVLANKDLRDAYEAAKRLKAATLFDEALDLVRWLKESKFAAADATDINAKRVALQGLWHAAGKLDPQQFGERSLATPAISIHINTNLDLGSGPLEEMSSGDGAMFSYTLQAKPLPVLDASVSDKDPDESAPKDSPVEARRADAIETEVNKLAPVEVQDEAAG